MKGRFKSPIWVIPVLAMVVALGAFAVMAGINQFSAQPAEANIQDPGQGLTSTANTEKLNEPFQNPLNAPTQEVTGMNVENNPKRPGASATYTIDFLTSSDGDLDTGQEVIVRFASEFEVPSSIDNGQVTISTNNTGDEDDGCDVSDTVSPTAVTVEQNVGEDNEETDLRLRIPDMVGGDACSGGQGIAADAEVRIIIQQGAGVENPAEGNAGRDVFVRTTTDTTPQSFALPVPWRVEMSSPDGSRGTSLTLVGLGFKNGQTTTFWLDENGDGVRDGNERDLCSAIASDNVATCTFSVSNPPFTPERNPGVDTADCTLDSINAGDANCNFINARDGANQKVTDTDPSIFDQSEVNRSVFVLQSTVEVSPSTANVGDRVTISLFDYPAGGDVNEIRVGGIPITNDTDPNLDNRTSGLQSIPSSGQESFTFTIPGNVGGTRIPTGTLRLRVITDIGTGDTNRFTNVTIGGASLTLSHEEVIANQDLTISGSGFSERAGGDEVCIEEGDIRLANIELEFDNNDLDCDLEDVDGKRLSSGGTFTLTVRVRDTSGNLDSSLLTAGSHELRVEDTEGSEGTVNVIIPEREIEVTPASARPRDVITIVGRGFPVDNPETGSVNIQLEYDCGAQTRTTSADPDGSGNFRETLRIPTNCSIPSTNTITADIGGGTNITETVTHEIPDALVRVEPVRGAPGTVVTVEGEGFSTFTTVDSIEFGGRGTLGGRTVNTDTNGNFSVDDILIPGVDPGIRSVTVTVDEDSDRETSASTTFEILATDVEGVPTDVLPGLAEPLGDNLVRAFYFNNTSKEWDFFDPREEFEDANSLHELVEGEAIWVRVTEDQTVTLNNEERDLTCVNPGTPEEDCWNLIVW